MRLTGWPDGARTHAATALAAGLASTAATNPVDVVKTHMFAAASGGGSGSSSGSGGAFACAKDIFKKYGAKGFARGFAANYARLGPQTLVTFAVAEQLRRLAGLQAL
jgi:solute carrier family 25 uncoupling protein 8/9